MRMALKDHMTRKIVTVRQDQSAAEAYRLMTNFWIRHLPVIDVEESFIIGMLSERDLLRSPSMETPVENLMSSPLKTFSVETPLKNVVDAMIEEKISAYLITKDEEVVGIVTSEDMLVLLDQLLKKHEDTSTWSLNEILINPALQRAAYLVGQAGI